MVMFVLSVSMELLILKNWDRFPLKEKGRKAEKNRKQRIFRAKCIKKLKNLVFYGNLEEIKFVNYAQKNK